MKFARFLVTSFLLVACGGESSSGGAQENAADASSTIDARTGCSSLENIGETITLTRTAEPAPAPQGGPIADGLYTLTSWGEYTGVGGEAGPTDKRKRMTIRIDGSLAESNFDDGPRAGTMTVEGTVMTTRLTCPQGGPIVTGFTATPSTLVVFDSEASQVMTFTKR